VTYSCLIPPIKVFIHSNVLIGCWDMICCVCIMHLVYMQQLLLCRAPWNSRKLQDSHIWLIPNITAVIYSNLFLGHWDMVYFVYIQHSSSCRVQFRSKESKESQIRQRRIWGCAHSVPTIQAFTHPNLFSGRWDMIYCMYRMYRMYLQWRFLCGPQLNSRKLYASHMWLIPNTQADIHSNVFMACWDMVYCVCMMYLVYMQQLLLCRLQLNLRKLQDSYIWLIPNITPFILSNLFIGHWDMMDLVYIQHSSSCRVQFHLLHPEEISYYVSGVAVDRPIVPNKFDIPKFLMLLLCVLASTLYKGKI